jgi:hypothetical protein
MRLPFADEIRDARRAAEEASRAAIDLTRIDAAAMSIGVFQGQLRFRPDLVLDPLPGEALIQTLAETWPVLGDLGSSTPRAAEPTPIRLEARGQQLELARRTLRALARDAETLAHSLHDLEHKQREMLEQPRYAAEAAELGRLVALRDEILRDLRPAEQRAAMLRPMAAVVQPFLTRLREELANREQPDPRGFHAWRAITLARAILESLASVLTPIHMEIPVPPPPARPGEPDPDPEVCASLWWDVEGICDRLDELARTIGEEGARLDLDRGRLAGRLEEITRAVHERTG